MKTRSVLTIMLLTLCLTMSACTSPEKTLLVFGESVTQFQNNVILAQSQGMISEDNTRKVLDICDKANLAGAQVKQILDATGKLDPESKNRIIDIMAAVSNSLDPEKIDVILNIKDPATKQKISGSIVIVRSAISSVMVVVNSARS